jgi:hypothetical protein
VTPENGDASRIPSVTPENGDASRNNRRSVPLVLPSTFPKDFRHSFVLHKAVKKIAKSPLKSVGP